MPQGLTLVSAAGLPDCARATGGWTRPTTIVVATRARTGHQGDPSEREVFMDASVGVTAAECKPFAIGVLEKRRPGSCQTGTDNVNLRRRSLFWCRRVNTHLGQQLDQSVQHPRQPFHRSGQFKGGGERAGEPWICGIAAAACACSTRAVLARHLPSPGNVLRPEPIGRLHCEIPGADQRLQHPVRESPITTESRGNVSARS